jgi:hypothetical protein
MIAISKGRKEDQAKMRAQAVSSRASRVHFELAESERLSRSQERPREPLEIIRERQQHRSNQVRIPRGMPSDHDQTEDYHPKYHIAPGRPLSRPPGWPMRKAYPGKATLHAETHSLPAHRTIPPSKRGGWSGRASPFMMLPLPCRSSYWGWKDHESYHPVQARRQPTKDNRSNHIVAATISNDESPPSVQHHPSASVQPPAYIKRHLSPSANPTFKRQKGLGKLDLLVQASLEMGPMNENPSGCSCPKSKCVALYCECFKAGRRCDSKNCSCTDCKNTINESGPSGARTLAIRNILARNPRAFLTAGTNHTQAQKLPPGEVACNCIRSRCLKLYCTCFHQKKTCKEGICSCVGCLNTDEDVGGDREHAIQSTLEKRPDAFQTRVKEVGQGCACKNNRCIRKYCECFRNSLTCTGRCSCSNCENHSVKPVESAEIAEV